MLLRARGKAVTAQDFEELTKEVAPEVARAHCLTAAHESQAGLVRVLIVPHVSSDALERVRREASDPLPETVQRITAHLDQRRLIRTRVVMGLPSTTGLRLSWPSPRSRAISMTRCTRMRCVR